MQIPLTIVVLHLDPPRYFSSGAFLTKSTDLPALQSFESRLTGRITYSGEVSCFLWGEGKSTSGLGGIDLINTDGALDGLLHDISAKGARVEIFTGNNTLSWAEFQRERTTRVARIEPAGYRACRIVTESLLAQLSRAPMQSSLYAVGAVIPQLELKPRPIAIGHPLSCPIPLVNTADAEYDCHDSAEFDSVAVVRDAGFALDDGVGYIAATAPGRFGIEKLAVAYGRVVADINGATQAIFGGGTALFDRVADIVKYVAVDRGGLDVDDLDATSLNALDDACPWPLSYWSGERAIYCADVLRAVLDSFCGFAYENAQGKLAVGRLVVPDADDSVYTITDSMIVAGTDISIEPDAAPGFSLVVGGARNWYRYTDAEIVDGVSDADRTMLIADYRVRAISTAPVSAEVADRALRPGISDGTRDDVEKPDIGIGTLLDEQADCQSLADAIAAIFPAGTVPRFFRMDCHLTAAARAVIREGSVVVVKNKRYGLSAGVPMFVKSISGAYGESRHTLKLRANIGD